MDVVESDAPGWRATRAAVARRGWLLGAVGGGLVVLVGQSQGWVEALAAGEAFDAWQVVFAVLGAAVGGAPVGGALGLQAAVLVLLVRGPRPAALRRARLAVACVAVGALVVGAPFALAAIAPPLTAGFDGWLVPLVAAVLGAVALAMVASQAFAVASSSADARPAAAWSPLLVGAALGPIALALAPAIVSSSAVDLGAAYAQIFVLFGIGLGVIAGLAFGVIAQTPFVLQDDRPRTRAGRIAAAVALMVVIAALTGWAAMLLLLLGQSSAAVLGGIVGGVAILVLQLALLPVARAAARHAGVLSRSR